MPRAGRRPPFPITRAPHLGAMIGLRNAAALGFGAVLAVTALGCSTGTGRSAHAFRPSAPDLTAIASQFDGAFDMPSSCHAVATPGSYKFATDASGVSWAFSTFSPGPACKLGLGENPDVGDLATVPPSNTDPTGRTAVTLRYTFQRARGKSWQINATSGTPFPCPALNGMAPGYPNGAFPKSVLHAWGLAYASGCADVFFTGFPH